MSVMVLGISLLILSVIIVGSLLGRRLKYLSAEARRQHAIMEAEAYQYELRYSY